MPTQRSTLLLLLLLWLAAAIVGSHAAKPNILLIVTDDQDVTLHGMYPLREVERRLKLKGATFSNSFTTSPLCCPSRASLLSGQYAHNHGTHNNSQSGGCYGTHWRQHIEPSALPTLLQAAGYRTFYAGKYLNEYRGERKPPGWQHFYGLHGNSRYYNFTLRENERNVHYNNNEYLTDKLANLTVQFIQERREQHDAKPFFAIVAPPAAHSPFMPAARHRGRFAGLQALKTPNFNRAANQSEKHWLIASGRLIPAQTLNTMDSIFQQRWETLLAVDDLVAATLDALQQAGELANTFVVYTSDNGYHVGQFAQPFDKRQPYETDIRVPLLVRGPGVPPGSTVTAAVALLDVYATILEWAGLPVPAQADGLSFQAYLTNAAGYDALHDSAYRRSLLVQHWGEGSVDTYNDECPYAATDRLAQCTLAADCHCQDSWNNTYACVRHFRYDTDRLYCEFKDNEQFIEVYDVGDDPFQMVNIANDLLPIEMAFYNLALTNLTKCSGSSCQDVHI